MKPSITNYASEEEIREAVSQARIERKRNRANICSMRAYYQEQQKHYAMEDWADSAIAKLLWSIPEYRIQMRCDSDFQYAMFAMRGQIMRQGNMLVYLNSSAPITIFNMKNYQ